MKRCYQLSLRLWGQSKEKHITVYLTPHVSYIKSFQANAFQETELSINNSLRPANSTDKQHSLPETSSKKRLEEKNKQTNKKQPVFEIKQKLHTEKLEAFIQNT